MKLIIYIATACIALAITSCENQTTKSETKVPTTQTVNGITTSTFKVWGNCDMCKETIEGSLKVDGITKVDWNTESKMITTSYDSTKITLNQIQKNISLVGYDNEIYKGDDLAYKALPECCQYDRK